MPDHASALNSMRLLDLLLQFFGPNGEHWLQGAFRHGRERRCLVDAIAYLRRKHGISGDSAAFFLYEALQPEQRRPGCPAKVPAWAKPAVSARLMYFNDQRCKNFDELRAVLIKARIRAAREFFHAAAQPNPERQAEIAAAKAADLAKEQAAAARKRQLLAELARERMMRHAAGDTRATYILSPRAPEPYSPERLAA